MTIHHHATSGDPVRRTTTTVLLACLALAAGTTACGSSGTTTAAAPATSSPTPSDTPADDTATDDAAADDTATPPTDTGPFLIGTPWQWQQGDGTTLSGSTTVLAYKQHIATDGPSPVDAFGSSSRGYVWAYLDVKICNDATSTDPLPVSNSPWTLVYDDGTQIEPSDTGYDTFPRPAFPMGDATVKAGRCLRGKIVFPVPGKGHPTSVDYAPAGLDTPITWDLTTKP